MKPDSSNFYTRESVARRLADRLVVENGGRWIETPETNTVTSQGISYPQPPEEVYRQTQIRELTALVKELASNPLEPGSDEWEDGYQAALAVVSARLDAIRRGDAL